MRTYRLTRKAARDYDRILYGYFQFGREVAAKWDNGAEATFLLIAEFPAIGRVYESYGKGVRRFNYGNEAIYYVERSDHILIRRIVPQQVDLAHL